MNTNPDNMTRRTTPDPWTLSLTQSVLNIASLPSAPTFDWAKQVARALAPLHASTSFGAVVAKHTQGQELLNIESSGVCLNHPNQHSSDSDLARSTLERLASSPINISESAKHSSYIAPITHVFPQCAATKASVPWAPGPPHQPNHALVAYATLPSTLDEDTNTSVVLLLFASTNHSSQNAIDPGMLAAALSALTHKAAEAIRPDSSGSILWLTQREQAILDQLILGNSVRAIAEDLGRSPHTVHDHVKNLHRKLGASSRGQLIARAIGHQTSSESAALSTPVIDPVLTRNLPTPPSVAELKPATASNAVSANQQKQQAVPLTRR